MWPQVTAWPHAPEDWQNAYCRMHDYREKCNYCSLSQGCVDDGFNFTNGCAFTLSIRFHADYEGEVNPRDHTAAKDKPLFIPFTDLDANKQVPNVNFHRLWHTSMLGGDENK